MPRRSAEPYAIASEVGWDESQQLSQAGSRPSLRHRKDRRVYAIREMLVSQLSTLAESAELAKLLIINDRNELDDILESCRELQRLTEEINTTVQRCQN